MHGLLQRLLKKKGIETVLELQPEEKVTYDGWEKILSKDEMNMDDIKHFCQSQIDIIESKWKDYDITNTKKAELIPYHSVYKALLQAIEAPKTAKEALEQYLNQLIK